MAAAGLLTIPLAGIIVSSPAGADAFSHAPPTTSGRTCREVFSRRRNRLRAYIDFDSNSWIGGAEENALYEASWQQAISDRADGSLWSSFESSDDSSEILETEMQADENVDGGEEAWLDALTAISADEVNFMSKEAERADKARLMEEMGYSAESISSTLGVATDEELEIDQSNGVFEAFKEETAKTGFGLQLDEEVDMELVESHTTVEWDDETDGPVRTQMVYVDEVSCVGCTFCANVAQSTFFMESEHGRARVFQQFGDDDETIQMAIDTCPVNCIHYVPYEELKSLEEERRGQAINNAARLVSGQNGHIGGHFGAVTYTGQQHISGKMDPDFEKKEAERREKIALREMKMMMESQNKRVEL